MGTEFAPLSRLLAAPRAGNVAVCRDGARWVRWEEFLPRVGGIASRLSRMPQKSWLLHCDHPLDFAAALLGLLYSGKRAVIPSGFEPGALDRLRGACDGVLGTGASATLDVSRLAPETRTFAPLAPEQAAIDLYTSGSSGEPKRVEKTLVQLETEARVLESRWGSMLDGATIVATVPHHHIYGLLFRLVWPLAAGRPFDATLCSEPQTLLERLALCSAAALVSTPAHLGRLPALIDLGSLAPATRCIFCSGGPLAPDAALAMLDRLGKAPIEIYGSTETGGIAWRQQDGGPGGAEWTPFPGISVNIGRAGELRLRSPYLAQNGWIALDDGAELLGDGRFRLTGRLDRVTKIEGKRVSLPEIEKHLREHPSVADAAVLALPGSKQTLGAVVVLRNSSGRSLGRAERYRLAATLRGFLRNWFEPVLVPRRWRFRDGLPVNDRGKVTPAGLARLFRNARDETTAG
jgi:acyl-coenzyme A synthetase/AMP-(fatty) acid ligase